jgi:cytochrome P450
MLKLAGLPAERGPELHAIVARISELDGDPSVTAEGIDRRPLLNIGLEAIAHRREAGADGSCPFIDKGLDAIFRGNKLTDLELATTLLLPLIGGVETLPKITSHGLWELARRPEQLAAVREDLTTNTAVVFDEMTRYCGPAQWFARTVTEKVEVLGETLLPGQRIIFLMQSASRDPREFENPDEFIWNRPIPRSLAFGQGDHFCMGIHLAKMEGRVILQEFLSLVDDYAIDMTAAVQTRSSFQKGWDYLPVEIRSYRKTQPVSA